MDFIPFFTLMTTTRPYGSPADFCSKQCRKNLFESTPSVNYQKPRDTRSLGFCQCCETWIRTMIHGFKGRCPTIRRSRNIIDRASLYQNTAVFQLFKKVGLFEWLRFFFLTRRCRQERQLHRQFLKWPSKARVVRFEKFYEKHFNCFSI